MNIDISNAYCGLGLFPGPRLSEGRNVNQSSSRLPTRNSSARLGVSRSRRSSVTARFYDQVPRITDRLAVVSSLQSPPCGPFLAGGGARGMCALLSSIARPLRPRLLPARERTVLDNVQVDVRLGARSLDVSVQSEGGARRYSRTGYQASKETSPSGGRVATDLPGTYTSYSSTERERTGRCSVGR